MPTDYIQNPSMLPRAAFLYGPAPYLLSSLTPRAPYTDLRPHGAAIKATAPSALSSLLSQSSLSSLSCDSDVLVLLVENQVVSMLLIYMLMVATLFYIRTIK